MLKRCNQNSTDRIAASMSGQAQFGPAANRMGLQTRSRAGWSGSPQGGASPGPILVGGV